MFGKKPPEVLIAGAGPVGLYAALALANQGIQIQIVDKEWRGAGHSYALALHAPSLHLLGEVGVLGRILEQSYRVRTVGLYDDSKRRHELQLAELDDEFPFVAVLQQDELEGILEEKLKEFDIRVLWNHEAAQFRLLDESVSLAVNKLTTESLGYIIARTERMVAKSQRLEVPFVIGADGHLSTTRRALGIEFTGIGEMQHFAVFEFKSDADLENDMRVILGDETLNVLWPLPEGYCRWSFQLLDIQAPEESRQKDRYKVQYSSLQYPELTADYLRKLIETRAPWFKGNIGEIRWRHIVRFERRLAGAFGEGRIWLAGDAAHMTGPVGVQSMNMGLQEAHDLAEDIGLILHHGESLEQLKDYGEEYQQKWRFLLGMRGGLQPTEHTTPWIKRHCDALLSCLPATGEGLVRLAKQLHLKVKS